MAMAVLAILIFAGASFFFALAETALFSLSKWQVRQLAERHPRAGKIVARTARTAAGFAGNTGAGQHLRQRRDARRRAAHGIQCALGARADDARVAGAGADRLRSFSQDTGGAAAGTLGVARGVAAVGFSKSDHAAASRRAMAERGHFERIAPRHGLAASVGALTDAEYQELLEMACQQGTLAESEKEIILQIISLDRRTARDVMRPRAGMACISDDATVEEMIAAARKFKHRRLPIYDETPDTIVGILNTRALLLDPKIDLAEAIEFPSFVPETMNLLQLVQEPAEAAARAGHRAG